MTTASERSLLRALFDAAVQAALPTHCLPSHLPTPPRGRTVVVGAGKAAAAMAAALEAHWPAPLSGLMVTRYGHRVPTRYIEVVEAAHPVPDQAGQDAALRIMQMVQGLGPDDLVLCLISGGGSALLAAPLPGLTLQDKQDINRALLRSGATIAEMNCVRKHLSAVKGGRLALLCGQARVETLIISDIPGDDPALVASGPTLPDATSAADALAVADKYHLDLPPNLRAVLASPAAETPKPGDARFAGHRSTIIASAWHALQAAAAQAPPGVAVHILSDSIEGEARDVALVHAAMVRSIVQHGAPFAAPCILLSGGETTVTVRGQGRGGRNSEFMLALAIALNGMPGVFGLACDTDGIDGSEDNAGAFISPDTLARAAAARVDARACLAANDAYSAFAALGDLLVCGPTLTNVNDFRAILITGAALR